MVNVSTHTYQIQNLLNNTCYVLPIPEIQIETFLYKDEKDFYEYPSE